ncbi:olfactory receptor 5AN1-like [Alligator mississippiensis]|uniref:olfactory receptor 5AN1-like n=1 Tax=Alligator mississippiensis TaxID=8496 RepID=UPI0028779D10|nr:olfactory receptor 5AN1-like [Alligator mississippiensis]
MGSGFARQKSVRLQKRRMKQEVLTYPIPWHLVCTLRSRGTEQMVMGNQTNVSYFILSGVSSDPQLQPFLFVVFLFIYLVTVVGNGAIRVVIRADPHFHTPMYFFLFHLSLFDICYSSVTVPKMLQNLLEEKKTIYLHGCIAQMSLLLFVGGTEVFILSAMAYDQYAAMCDPLRYLGTMNKELCIQLKGGAWVMGTFYSLTNAAPALHLHFCGHNEVHNFNSELPSLLEVSCTETFTSKMAFLTSTMISGLTSISITLVSYICIISSILRIRSAKGRGKAFSTCISHITVVVLYYGAGLFRYLRPTPASSVVLDRLFSIQYSILTPMLNPIIYSLRNKEVKAALGNILQKMKGT